MTRVTHDQTQEKELMAGVNPADIECCATCGEAMWDMGEQRAEVVRHGKRVLVHADTCMLEGEEVA